MFESVESLVVLRGFDGLENFEGCDSSEGIEVWNV